MTIYENFNGITVRELKIYLEKWEKNNVAKSIWPLNTNDILFGSNLNEERVNKMSILIQTLQDFAEYECAYGDGCPEFVATRHGVCISCKARKALQKCGVKVDG